jgi:UDP-N-acetylglucosamine--N-acetylmuramyl-(pentapeptide) pyrophosphoryl-undecaprenol N-acetylglucosamine transferase
MRILYIGGGSTGHLAPLVAVEKGVRAIDPKTESLFLCSDRAEDAMYLSHEKVQFKQVPLPHRSLTMPIAFIQNYFSSKKIINEFKPDAIFSKGGAVSVPACMAAHHLKIPIVLHESDAVMGRANQIVARWAKTICLGFPLTETRDERRETSHSRLDSRISSLKIVTGNPIRSTITQGSREEGLKITGLTGSKPIMLAWGGSQGAEALNKVVREQIDEILKFCDVIHLTGKGKKGASPRAGYWSTELGHAEVPHFLAIASFALSRAGAGSISELAANGIPTILVPIEGLANNHQLRNATMAQENGGCIILLQRDLEPRLLDIVRELSSDSEYRAKIAKSMQQLHRPDASGRIAEIIARSVARHPSTH